MVADLVRRGHDVPRNRRVSLDVLPDGEKCSSHSVSGKNFEDPGS
jgi:hypothetical protein